MGLQKLMLLVVMLLFSFCSSASFAHMIPENTHENIGDNIIDENNTTFGSGSAMDQNHRKYTTALRRGGGGGRSGSAGDGGQSNTSPQGGGNGVVPVYAAGAAGYARNHKGGASNYAPCWKGRFAVLTATLAYLLLYIPV